MKDKDSKLIWESLTNEAIATGDDPDIPGGYPGDEAPEPDNGLPDGLPEISRSEVKVLLDRGDDDVTGVSADGRDLGLFSDPNTYNQINEIEYIIHRGEAALLHQVVDS